MAWFDPPQYNGPTEQALLSSLNATLDAIVAEGNSIDTLWMDTLMGQTGITLLQSAAQRGYANLTATLLTRGAQPDVLNLWGWHALMFAAGAPAEGGERPKMILSLIHAGTNINLLAGDSYKYTALVVAEHYNCTDAANLLKVYQATKGRNVTAEEIAAFDEVGSPSYNVQPVGTVGDGLTVGRRKRKRK